MVDSRTPDLGRNDLARVPEELRGWEWRHLSARLAPDWVSISDFEQPHAYRVSPRGDLVAVVPLHKEIEMISAETHEVLWRRSFGRPRVHIEGRDVVRTADYAWRESGDEFVVLIARQDMTAIELHTVDAMTGEVSIRPLISISEAPQALHLSPGAHRALVVGGQRGEVYDVATRQHLWSSEYMTSIRSMPTASWVQWGWAVFDADTGEKIPLPSNTVSMRATFAAQVLPDQVLIHDVADPTSSPRAIRSVGAVARAHASRDGRFAAITSGQSTEIWDLERMVMARPPIPTGTSGFSLLGDDRFVCGGDGGKVYLAPLRPAQASEVVHESYVYGAAVSPDNRRLCTGSWDKTARVWDLETGEELARFDLGSIVQSVTWTGRDPVVALREARSAVARDVVGCRERWRQEFAGVRLVQGDPSGR